MTKAELIEKIKEKISLLHFLLHEGEVTYTNVEDWDWTTALNIKNYYDGGMETHSLKMLWISGESVMFQDDGGYQNELSTLTRNELKEVSGMLDEAIQKYKEIN